jgi:serine/threonine protein kinase
LEQLTDWTRVAGSEPIPGYRLVEPLGSGGFGEVWKCEAPGGLFKAVKFVGTPSEAGGTNAAADQELAALQSVKSIRHPFLLSLDRVEVLDGVLVIIMELADKSLHTLQADYQAEGHTGIPRDELLGYLLEAAEALDWMNFGHGLQHLDVKPHNLFLVSNHVKVADFGLVHSLGEAEAGGLTPRRGGVTPLYAAPEVLRGNLSRHSDQYSLAIVYQQLVTGTVPFWHQNPYQLMLLHVTAEPCLATLPPADRPLIARALAKSPEQRFPSCLDLVQALLTGAEVAPVASPQGGSRPSRHSGLFRRVAKVPGEDDKPTKSVRRPTSSSEAAATSVVAPEGLLSTASSHPDAGPLAAPTPESGDHSSGNTPDRAQPTSVALPGYRFLHCISQSPLGDVWKVTDEAGQERRALCLYSFVGHDQQLIDRLQGLQHPALPAAQVSWSPSGRVVLVTEPFTGTLRDRFDACLASGQQGVPRGELLGCLRVVAEALDALNQEQGVPHLGLSPRSILLQAAGVRLADFGLVPLVWLPTGQPAGQLNPRYAAPELFDRGDSPTSDQYSLALIFAEMLTGIPPRPHRGPVNGPGSGLHRRLPRNPSKSGSRPVPTTRKGPTRIDFDLVPSGDRDILARALADDPRQRFGSCLELIRALEGATLGMPSADDLYHNLPPVIPFASLMGEPAAPDTVLPSVNQVIHTLAPAAEPQTVQGAANVRYRVLPGGVWEYQCPLQVFAGTLRLKVDGFRQHWGARLVREEDSRFLFHLNLEPPRRFQERTPPRPPRLELLLEVQSPGPERRVCEARARLRPVSGTPDQVRNILTEMGPVLFDSLRSYLQAGPEQRTQDRWPCMLPLHVYPVRPDLDLGPVLEAVGRNLSYGGISFRVPQLPSTEKVYLHWAKSPRAAAFAVLAHVVRFQEAGPRAIDVGAAFPRDDSDTVQSMQERWEEWR